MLAHPTIRPVVAKDAVVCHPNLLFLLFPSLLFRRVLAFHHSKVSLLWPRPHLLLRPHLFCLCVHAFSHHHHRHLVAPCVCFFLLPQLLHPPHQHPTCLHRPSPDTVERRHHFCHTHQHVPLTLRQSRVVVVTVLQAFLLLLDAPPPQCLPTEHHHVSFSP